MIIAYCCNRKHVYVHIGLAMTAAYAALTHGKQPVWKHINFEWCHTLHYTTEAWWSSSGAVFHDRVISYQVHVTVFSMLPKIDAWESVRTCLGRFSTIPVKHQWQQNTKDIYHYFHGRFTASIIEWAKASGPSALLC